MHGWFITASALSAYAVEELAPINLNGNERHEGARTMTFRVLALSQLVHAINQRSNYDSVFRPGQGHNHFLYGAMAASLAIVAFVSFVPGIMDFFELVYLDWSCYLIVLALAVFLLVAVEITKVFMRIWKKRHTAAQPDLVD